jgi:quinol monooxygenase YgiN
MTGATSPVIVVVARWQVAGDRLGEVLGHVAELRRSSLAEPGCLGYEVFNGMHEPATVLLLEHYRDDAALDAHRQSAHYQALVVERILPLLAGRQVEILRSRDPV